MGGKQIPRGFHLVPLHLVCTVETGAQERYEAGFNHIKTRNPLFVIGNTLDPATSIRAAFNISAGFEDSVVLTQDGYGVSHHLSPSSIPLNSKWADLEP